MEKGGYATKGRERNGMMEEGEEEEEGRERKGEVKALYCIHKTGIIIEKREKKDKER